MTSEQTCLDMHTPGLPWMRAVCSRSRSPGNDWACRFGEIWITEERLGMLMWRDLDYAAGRVDAVTHARNAFLWAVALANSVPDRIIRKSRQIGRLRTGKRRPRMAQQPPQSPPSAHLSYRLHNPNTRPPDSRSSSAAVCETYRQATATRMPACASLSDPRAVSNRARALPLCNRSLPPGSRLRN